MSDLPESKWIGDPDGYVRARVGHLYVSIENNGGYKHPGHPDYEAPRFNWYIAPDDEDKSDRRSLASGCAMSLDQAKRDSLVALRQVVSHASGALAMLEAAS